MSRWKCDCLVSALVQRQVVRGYVQGLRVCACRVQCVAQVVEERTAAPPESGLDVRVRHLLAVEEACSRDSDGV